MARAIHKRFASLLLVLLFSVGAWAHDSGESTPPKEFYSSEDLKNLSIPELRLVEREIEVMWKLLVGLRNTGADDATVIAALKPWARFQCSESIGSIFQNLYVELRQEPEQISLAILKASLDVLGEIMTVQPEKLLADFAGLKELADAQLGTEEGQAVVAEFDKVLEKAKTRNYEPITVRFHLAELMNTPNALKENLEAMQKRLEKRIIGQPEVVEALMAMEWANQLYKNTRFLPDFIYLMGLPGTGKDTTAEAFTDALWDEEGAHQEHMFRLPILKGKPELWQVLGSSTGYVGSDQFPPFLEFLVNHSGGRYLMQPMRSPMGGVSYSIVENPEWKGENIPGYFTPDKAVVFANELHNWSKDNKDVLLKQALEKGYFTVNNPNGGVAQIYVPVRFVMASNEGIPLVTSREANGQRFGKPLTYEQMMQKWERAHTNKDSLKNEILSTNGEVNSANQGSEARGTSEELLNRLQPERFLMLLRPLSPDHLRDIASQKLKDVRNRLAKESAFFASVDLTWDRKLIDFVQSYDYMPEDNARPIKGKVETLILETILNAVRDNDFPISSERKKVAVHLSFEKNDDDTTNLIMNYTELGQPTQTISKLIGSTVKDRPRAAISDERIRHLSGMAARLKKRVFGVDVIADRLADRMIAIENQRHSGGDRRASVIVALGLTSTGKTELSKALTAEGSGDEKDLLTLDFSQIQTLEDFKKRILGTRDALGNPVKSDFMKHYDRNDGVIYVAFDELANVRDRDLLTALYDFFREPVLTTFSDGKPRKMTGVVVIVTGNAGQELYANVPRDVPMEQQMAAWQEISEHVARDAELQRKILERYFPAPLVTRWGKNNTFFFPPHTFKSLRQLAQFKLEKEIERLGKTKSRRGWKVALPSVEEYSKLIDAVVEEGFSLRYQGASIDSFILEDLGESLESLLLKNFVPSGSTVVLKYIDKTDNSDEKNPGFVNFKVYVENQREPLDFAFKRPHLEKPFRKTEESQKITAFHEAGHSIVGQKLFSKNSKPGMISIIPGVTMIGEEWVAYNGIATSEGISVPHQDRSLVLGRIAVWAAGETAERMVTHGEVHTAGKADDMKRASNLAQDAILRYGLSPKWGTRAIPSGMKMSDYLGSLSDSEKQLLQDEVRALVEEGRLMARKILEANFEDVLIPLANMLAEKGTVSTDEIREFYSKVELQDEAKRGKFSFKSLIPKWLTRNHGKSSDNNSLIRSEIPTVEKVANVDEIVRERKLKQFREVPVPEKLPLGTNSSYDAAHSSFQGVTSRGDCETQLRVIKPQKAG